MRHRLLRRYRPGASGAWWRGVPSWRSTKLSAHCRHDRWP